MQSSHKVGATIGMVLLIASVAIGSFWAFGQIDEAIAARKHNYTLIIGANALLAELVDAETGQRGYLLTGEELLLEPYLMVRDSVESHLSKLRGETHIKSAQNLIDAVTPLIAAKMAYLSQTIELRRKNDMAAVVANVRNSQGKQLMDTIRTEIARYVQIEETALLHSDANVRSSMRDLFIILVAASLILFLAVLLFVYAIYKESQNRLKTLVHIETEKLLAIQIKTNEQLQLTNETLVVSEEKLAVTLNCIGDAVIATDAEACVTLLNPIAEKLTGWMLAEAIGHPVDEIFQIVNETTRQPATIPVKAALAHGTIQGLANHTILIARSGRECAIDDSCAPIRNSNGIVVGAVLVFRDITERRAIENGLETARKELEIIKKLADEASEFSESLINTVREPLLSLDQDLRVVTVSRSFYDFFKVKPEETVGQLIYDLGNKQWDIPKLRELLETILPQKTTFDNYEVEHDFATIGRRIMLLNARQIQRGLGKKRIILLAIEDITERKEIENELQKVRLELERIVQVQKVVISDTKESLDHETEGRLFEEGEVSHRQEALEAVYAMETAFDSNIESLYDQIVVSIATTLRTPFVGIYEYRDGKIIRGSQCLDGSVSQSTTSIAPCAACRFVLDAKHPQQFSGNLDQQFIDAPCFDTVRFHSFAGVPINGPQGDVFGLVNVLDDKSRTFTDSEIKFIETFGRYIAHELSRRGLESRVRRAEEMRLLGQLTSGVAHEVRNPLNGILAIMGALSKELADNARFEPYMQHMRNQVTRLTGLMEDLLALGRPLREENSLEISMVALVENTLLTWLQTQQSPKPQVRFIKPQETDTFPIRADSAYMTQIIINLIQNAHNHSPEASAEIVCSVHGHNGNVIFSVIDRGSGIAKDILPRIFDPFFTTRKGGTGLGLSIVRNIVENHRGSVTAFNNTDGPGATFEVVLPRCIQTVSLPVIPDGISSGSERG